MKIFISHSHSDEKLAKILKNILEDDKSIKEAFMFEIKKKYGVQIDKKITDEIDQSDYLVALITINSNESASVNQELGYAQAKGIEKIPMIQNGAKKGFLVYGTENVDFTNNNFKEKCLEVKKYVVKNGVKQKFSSEENTLIQKSAFYRQIIEYRIHNFLDSIYYRFNVGGKNYPGLVSHGDPKLTKEYIENIRNFFKAKDEKLIILMSEIDFTMYKKLDIELMNCKSEIKDAEIIYPHSDFPQKEADLLVKLKDSLFHVNENDLDLRKYCKDLYDILDPKTSFNFTNCKQMMHIPNYEHDLRGHLRWTLSDLRKIIFLMIELVELYLEYKKKFGGLAFKNPT